MPRVRTIIASLLHQALDCGSPAYLKRHNDRVMKRNESAMRTIGNHVTDWLLEGSTNGNSGYSQITKL